MPRAGPRVFWLVGCGLLPGPVLTEAGSSGSRLPLPGLRLRSEKGERCPELSAQGLVPLRWGCALPSANALGKAPNHIHTTLRWGRAPGKPSLALGLYSIDGLSLLPATPQGSPHACPPSAPSGEPGVSGDFWGSQEGCQGPSRPSGRNRGSPSVESCGCGLGPSPVRLR